MEWYYLQELIRYIHLNPVRAKLISDPQQYHWSSHRAYMELDEFTWLEKNRVLKKFSFEQNNAVKAYEKYVLQGIGIETELNFKSGHTNGMLGSQEFVEDVLDAVLSIPQPKIELIALVTRVCEMHYLTREQLCMPGKQPKYSEARALLALIVREIDHLSLKSLGELLGRDASGLTALANRLEIKISKDLLAAKNLEQIRLWLKTL